MNKTKLTPLQQDILRSLHPEKWSILDAEMNYLSAVELVQQGLAERHSEDLRKFRLGEDPSIEPMDILWHAKNSKHDRCPECHGPLAMVSAKVRSCGACQVDYRRCVK